MAKNSPPFRRDRSKPIEELAAEQRLECSRAWLSIYAAVMQGLCSRDEYSIDVAERRARNAADEAVEHFVGRFW